MQWSGVERTAMLPPDLVENALAACDAVVKRAGVRPLHRELTRGRRASTSTSCSIATGALAPRLRTRARAVAQLLPRARALRRHDLPDARHALHQSAAARWGHCLLEAVELL